MADYFRTKIVAKRQITLPQLMLLQLGLKEGDELEFEVEDGQIRAVQPYRLVPTDYFTPEILEMIALQKQVMADGKGDVLELPLKSVRRSQPARGFEAMTPRADDRLAGSRAKLETAAMNDKVAKSY